MERISASEVYNMDCIKFMKQFPDDFFDVAITDPPYGINAEHGTNRASRKQFKDMEIGWDSKIPEKEYFDELLRVSKQQIIWGGNYFLDYLGNCRCYIIWDKLNPDRNFSDCELAWTSFDQVARIYKEKRVQELNKLDEGKIHPTQKPVALYHWTMKRYCESGQKILDTHLGSGSSRIAAQLLGIDFYATELSEHYYTEQDKRYKKFMFEKNGLILPDESSFSLD